MLVWRIQEDSSVLFISRIQINDCYPDAVNAAELRLQATGVWMFADARGFLADCLRDGCHGKMNFASDTCSVKPARCWIKESRISTYKCRSSQHGSPSRPNGSVSFRYRQGIAKASSPGWKSKHRWFFNPDSTRPKKSLYLFSTTYEYLRLPIGPCNSLKLRVCSHSSPKGRRFKSYPRNQRINYLQTPISQTRPPYPPHRKWLLLNSPSSLKDCGV
jgi:hypothetical protein